MGSKVEKTLCEHMLAGKIVGSEPSDASSELQMLSELEPTTAVVKKLFQKLILFKSDPHNSVDSLIVTVQERMADYIRVLDEESSAYLAKFVAILGSKDLSFWYFSSFEETGSSIRAMPGALYGLSIIQRSQGDQAARQRLNMAVRKWHFGLYSFVWVLDGLDRIYPIFKDAAGLDRVWLDSVVCIRAQFIVNQCVLASDDASKSKDLLLMGKKLLQWHRVAISQKMPPGPESCLGKIVARLEELSLQVPALTDTVVRYLHSKKIPIKGRGTLLQGQLVE